MIRILGLCAPLIATVLFTDTAGAVVSEETRTSIERAVGHKGSYIPEEDVYKVILPREEAAIVQDYQTLSPNLGLNSWVAFTSGIHHEALLTGQFLLLDDEVNPVLEAALDAGLEVTGLAVSSPFHGPHLQTLDVTGIGTFRTLASGFRRGLDEIHRVRKTAALSPKKASVPTVPMESAIDPDPLDAVFSMKGRISGGVYKAAIGSRTLLNGELIGREMGMSTWISIAGKNDRALVQGEFIEGSQRLSKLLRALRAKGINIASIRNHTLGEHPQWVFVRFWGEGTAVQLAQAVRYALDTQVGRIPSGSEKKI
ncbi:MAG: DUF1259 domain-containing protein [Bryobacteraceae bacterium]